MISRLISLDPFYISSLFVRCELYWQDHYLCIDVFDARSDAFLDIPVTLSRIKILMDWHALLSKY